VPPAQPCGHHRALRQGGRGGDGRCAALKVISKHGSGTDTIDKAAAQAARGIQVVAAVGANAAAVAEQALALLLACAKSVVALDERMHAGHWDKATHKSVELEGRTVGLWAWAPSACALPAWPTRWACA
jgi:phosphoglycerate dehydrogenase-like enzyme